MATSQKRNDLLAYILFHLKEPETIQNFSDSLQEAIEKAIKSGSFKEFDLVLETWEAITILEGSEDAKWALQDFVEGKRDREHFPIA